MKRPSFFTILFFIFCVVLCISYSIQHYSNGEGGLKMKSNTITITSGAEGEFDYRCIFDDLSECDEPEKNSVTYTYVLMMNGEVLPACGAKRFFLDMDEYGMVAFDCVVTVSDEDIIEFQILVENNPVQ